jgi:DNA repair exonuclease SbcCD ATPase subunit
MQLSAPGRREVIEDILDIKIFSSMNEVVKNKLRGIRDNVKVLDLKKENLSDKISMQKNFIKELEGQGQERIKKKKNTLNELVVENEELLESNEVKNKELLTISNKMTDVSNATVNLKKLGTLKGRVSNKVSTATSDLKFFKENTVCPTCTQHIEEEFRLNKVVDAQSKLDELSSGLDDLLETIKTEETREHLFNKLSKEVTRLTHEISNNNIRISGIHKQSKNLGNEIQTITSNLQNKNSEHEKLETFKQDLESSYNKITEQKIKERDYDFVYSLLKDGGVKTKIIKKYLPLINQQINRYLQMMDFYINFTLDEEFNESVKSPIHEDFSYASFSEGEKMRIDLALLFTWREVARFKNSTNTNLLIMDEVFDSSLDTFGTDEFMKIIRYVLKGANIFIISHKTELLDKFSATIKFEKIKGFSHLL